MTSTKLSRRWTAGVAVTASALALALPAYGAAPTSHATRMREYKQMIVGLYRVPAAERSGEAPLDTLWRSLAAQYGVVSCPDAPSGAEA